MTSEGWAEPKGSFERLSQREYIRTVADRWAKQYPRDQPLHNNRRSKDIEDKLRALDLETATPDDIARIIGNYSWTRPMSDCYLCGERTPVLLLKGRCEDIFYLCADCTKQLSDAVNNMENQDD